MAKTKLTYKEEAKEKSFEQIFEEQNKLKIQKAVVEKDITVLEKKKNQLASQINRLTQVASVKRRAIVEKK